MMDKFNDLSIKDNLKRNRKPDMEIYVPRIVAQNKKPDQENSSLRPHKKDNYMQDKEIIGDSERNSFSHANGNKRFDSHPNDRFNINKSKRYSTNRRPGGEHKDFNDDWGERNSQSRQVFCFGISQILN